MGTKDYGQTTEGQGGQNGTIGSQADTGRQERPSTKTGNHERQLTSGSTGNDWDWGVIAALTEFSGGMLGQFIIQLEDELAENQACIEWYADRKQKIVEKLSRAKGLQHLLERAQANQ